jgi:DNA topoisomerase-3
MLILCEKPSVAKDFAGALDCETKKGYYQRGETVITYAVGHLFQLCDPEIYNPAHKTWDAAYLPIIPQSFRYERIQNASVQTAVVISLLKAHARDTIVIATDAGREGELIARIILSESGITDISRIKRFWVSEALTKDVIIKGLKEAQPLSAYDKIAGEGFARQRADWLIGINLTRYMTIGNTTLFSVGRVQTAVLNAIALRNKEVAHFTTVPFNELEGTVQSSTGTLIKASLINPENEKTAFFTGRDYISAAREYCSKNAISHFNSHVTKETIKPPKLLNITGLQKAAYKLYGYTPERTLEIAQVLYERYKCLSYPRTPSRVMGDQNVELFKEKYGILSNKYPHYARLCDESCISLDNKNIFNSAALEDHHALIPLKPLPEEASAQERTVFEIVLKSFFTVCMPDYLYNKKRLVFHVGEYSFRSQVNEVLQYGFKETLKDTHDSDDDVQEVEKFDEKTCKLLKLEILHKETRAKREFSIDTLLGFMENPYDDESENLTGLGTPATRAAIVKLLFDRDYIREERKKLYATRKGLFLLAQLQKSEQLMKLADIRQTTQWEKQLAKSPEEFETSIVQFLKECIKKEKKEVFSGEPLGFCPRCGNPVVAGKTRYYCSGYKNESPCNFGIFKTINGAVVSRDDISALLAHKDTSLKTFISKSGKKYKAVFSMESDGKITLKFQEPKKTGSNPRKGNKGGTE